MRVRPGFGPFIATLLAVNSAPDHGPVIDVNPGSVFWSDLDPTIAIATDVCARPHLQGNTMDEAIDRGPVTSPGHSHVLPFVVSPRQICCYMLPASRLPALVDVKRVPFSFYVDR
ncbi:hypothetical protein EVAR_24263_1 [Eumeta japonica]|uniref:Uncharacterized protein n=1 Tax=Eumeta variegata TaxID=151549 RepID=A0A4C1VE36_EUMVA|nr:hypothetical protein EVAR_24263_1 [Eumeta japonica]